MMRCLNVDQKNLHEQYSILGKEVASISKQERQLMNEKVWHAISKEGIWHLPIDKKYGGKGLTWQDCVVALDGFFSHYSDIEFLTLLMSHISSLYLISQYGTSAIKKRYLPRLMQGETAQLLISQYLNKLFSEDAYFKKRENQILSIKNNKIFIHAEKFKNNIEFYITEKTSYLISSTKNKSANSILNEGNKFIAKEVGVSALCDLINFERLLYGLLSANHVRKLKQQNNI